MCFTVIQVKTKTKFHEITTGASTYQALTHNFQNKYGATIFHN